VVRLTAAPKCFPFQVILVILSNKGEGFQRERVDTSSKVGTQAIAGTHRLLHLHRSVDAATFVPQQASFQSHGPHQGQGMSTVGPFVLVVFPENITRCL